jgi:formylmethanofuran dehydrogenase subunit E
VITLSESLSSHLDRSAALHTRLCPRQVLGVRMARFACSTLGIDPAVRRKQIFVYMECGRCAADAVIAVTGASPTNELMKLMRYGKVAATFVNMQTGEALRVAERQESRESAVQIMPPKLTPWQAQLEAYQILPDDLLFRWQSIIVNETLPPIPDKRAVTCECCEDRVNEHCEVIVQGRIMCKACAFGAYYSPVFQAIEAHL